MLTRTLHDHWRSLYSELTDIYFRTRRPREVMVVLRTWTNRRLDPRTTKDILLMTGGSRTNGQRGQSRDCLFVILSDPPQPFPPFLTPCHLLFLEPIIVVMHFSFYPSKTFAFLNTTHRQPWLLR